MIWNPDSPLTSYLNSYIMNVVAKDCYMTISHKLNECTVVLILSAGLLSVNIINLNYGDYL